MAYDIDVRHRHNDTIVVQRNDIVILLIIVLIVMRISCLLNSKGDPKLIGKKCVKKRGVTWGGTEVRRIPLITQRPKAYTKSHLKRKEKPLPDVPEDAAFFW